MAEIKKTNSIFPKMFRTFTTYIFMTLLVFFAYVQIFGNVSPSVISLPTGSAGAEETSVFGSFVNSIMGFENIDADFELSFSNATNPNIAEEDKVTLSLNGNVVYDESGISLSLQFSLNEKEYSAQVVYVGSYIFLTLENEFEGDVSAESTSEEISSSTTYMFDASAISSDMDIVELFNFVASYINVDLSFLDDIASNFGIDLDNFDVTSLVSLLDTSKSKKLDDGGYEVIINIKNVIELDILCDENFNIISATSNHIKVNYNEIYLNVNVNKMNDTDVATGEESEVRVDYEISGEEIDLTGLAIYSDYALKLLNNDHVVANFYLKINDENLDGKIYLDNEDELQIAFVAEINGAELQIVYVDQTIYVDIDGARISFDVNDFESWKDDVCALFDQYSDQIADVLKEVFDEIYEQVKSEYEIEEDFEDIIENFDILQLLEKVLSENFTVTDSLPSKSELFENSYVLTWKNGLRVELINSEIQQKNVLSQVNVTYGQNFELEIEFEIADSGYVFGMEDEDFYDLMSNQNGTLTLTYTENEESAQFVFNIELGLESDFYARINGTVLGEQVEVVVLENVVYVKLGDICVSADLSDIDELIDLFDMFCGGESFFNLEPAQMILEILQFLKSYETNSITFGQIDDFEYNITADTITFVFDVNSNISINLELNEHAEIDKVSAPVVTDEIESVATKIKNLYDLFESGKFAFDYSVNYNGLVLTGTFIYVDGDIEISVDDFFGERAVIRFVNDMIYLQFGNYMKFKFDMPSTDGSTDIISVIEKVLADELGVTIQLGVFENLAEILTTYTLEDYMKNMSINIEGSLQNMTITLSQLGKLTNVAIMDILSLNSTFDNDNLSTIAFSIYDVLTGNAKLNTSINSLTEFDEEEYVYYNTDFAEVILSNLETSEGVIAFSSDLSIRYSNNTFYGELTALLIPTEDENGEMTYTPAVSLYTTSLGLSTYIYLIDNTIYIDLNGLQIYADLSENTVEEIIDFIYENFGEFLESEDGETVGDILETIETTTDAFKVILPALDQIYGTWLTVLTENGTYNGIQINIGKTVSRENIVKTESVYNETTGEWETVETYSTDIADYGGQGNVLQYGENYWFYNIVLQIFMQEGSGQTILPTKLILGANIYDPNTVLYSDYSEYLLDCEESVTANLNFAVYLTNISVGNNVENLDKLFISEAGANDLNSFQNIVAVKSNTAVENSDGSTSYQTNLEDFNSYATLLEIIETTKNYAWSKTYQFNLNGTISSQDSTSTTEIDGEVKVKVEEVEGETNASGIDLFDGMALTVQATDLDVVQKTNGTATAEHLINLIYESDGEGLFVTYTHDNLSDDASGVTTNNNIGSNYFRAKIGNSNLSEIISMLVALFNINLGDSLTQALSLDENPNTTDFTYLQTLLGISTTSESVDISKADQVLSSVENMTKMLKNIKLDKVLTDESQGLYTTTLTITLDFNANDEEMAGQDFATLELVFEQEIESSSVVQKLSQISIQNVVIGENVMNFVIDIEDFDDNFDYFDNNPKDEHIDFSELSNFVDVAVSTLNTKTLNFKGTTNVSILGLSAISVGFDIEVGFDENNEFYMYMELDVGATREVTWTAVAGNYTYTTYNVVALKDPWSKRITTIEYKNDTLNIVNTSYNSRTTDLSSAKDIVKTYTYSKDEIGSNIMLIITQALGLTDATYSIIKYAINRIEAYPTIEQSLIGFEYDGSNYKITINAENLTGMSGMKDITLTIGTSDVYETQLSSGSTKSLLFIDSISTQIVIGSESLISIPLELNSVTGTSYVSGDGKTMYTNDYYRKQYISSVGQLI